jgi:negative regulator of sigma E activity
MSDSIGPREYGQLEAHVAQLRDDVKRLQDTVNEMSLMMQQARGGWRAIAMMSGIAGAIGAAITWGVQHLKFAP